MFNIRKEAKGRNGYKNVYSGKNLLPLLLLAISNISYGRMPSPPSGNIGEDVIRTSDGTECRSQNGGNLQVYGGVYSNELSQVSDYINVRDYNNYATDDAGVYLGASYSFGGGKRIDCSKLYNVELQRHELELERLRSEIDTLKKAKSFYEGQASGMIPDPLNLKGNN